MGYLDQRSIIATGLIATLGTAAASAAAATVAISLIVTPVDFAGVVFFFFFMTLVAIAAVCMLALPLTLLLQTLSRESGPAYVVAGAASGGTAILVLFGFEPLMLLCGLLAGAVGGLTWWRSFRRHFQETGDRRG